MTCNSPLDHPFDLSVVGALRKYGEGKRISTRPSEA